MKALSWLAIASCALVLAACGGGGTASPPPAAAPPQSAAKPGDPAVYREIAAMTDCAQVQASFDRAYANWQREHAASNLTLAEITLAYAKASEARLQALGC